MPQDPRPTEIFWLLIMVNSAKLTMAYERAKAPHPFRALISFSASMCSSLGRLIRLGFPRHIQLLRLELECAAQGLSYPNTNVKIGPPWQLPDTFANITSLELPNHPLIEPVLLSAIATRPNNSGRTALIDLHQLLSPHSLDARWKDVPRLGTIEPPILGNARIAVCLHLFYPELWPSIKLALATIPEAWDLYITVPEFACTTTLASIAAEHPSICFLPCANRGRDVLPFLNLLKTGALDRYDAICKLHSKRSLHMKDGAQWLAQILTSLVGNREEVAELIQRMRDNPKLGLIGPKAQLIDPEHSLHKACNRHYLQELVASAALPNSALQSPFFAGTMFWFRAAAFSSLRALKLRKESFPIEMAQTDGTPAHAIERLIWPLVEQAGFTVEASDFGIKN